MSRRFIVRPPERGAGNGLLALASSLLASKLSPGCPVLESSAPSSFQSRQAMNVPNYIRCQDTSKVLYQAPVPNGTQDLDAAQTSPQTITSPFMLMGLVNVCLELSLVPVPTTSSRCLRTDFLHRDQAQPTPQSVLIQTAPLPDARTRPACLSCIEEVSSL